MISCFSLCGSVALCEMAVLVLLSCGSASLREIAVSQFAHSIRRTGITLRIADVGVYIVRLEVAE